MDPLQELSRPHGHTTSSPAWATPAESPASADEEQQLARGQDFLVRAQEILVRLGINHHSSTACVVTHEQVYLRYRSDGPEPLACLACPLALVCRAEGGQVFVDPVGHDQAGQASLRDCRFRRIAQ